MSKIALTKQPRPSVWLWRIAASLAHQPGRPVSRPKELFTNSSFTRAFIRQRPPTALHGEGREAVLPVSIGLKQNVRHHAPAFDLPADGVAVMVFIAIQDFTGGMFPQLNEAAKVAAT